MAFQCEGCFDKNSLTAMSAPHANVAGACEATCNKRFTIAAERFGTTSSRKLLKISDNTCALFADRKSPGCNSKAYSAR